MLNILNKFYPLFTSVRGRAILLVAVPVIFTCLFFVYISLSSIDVIQVTLNSDNQTRNQGGASEETITDFFNVFSQFSKLPTDFINFNIYLKNGVSTKNVDGTFGTTSLNISIFNKYTGGIETGQTKIIASNLNVSNFSNAIPAERSFSMEPNLGPKDGAEYMFFILPTISTIVFACFAAIILWYGFIVLLSLLLKFIISGFPLNEIYKN